MSNPYAQQPSNISIFDQSKEILPVYWAYSSLGLFALIANIFIVLVYLSSPLLRKRFALFIGLAVAEGINGAAFLVTGIERINEEYSLQNVYVFPMNTRSYCAAQFGNTLQIIGSQGPALLSLALGIERFCAIKFPASYRRFKERMFHCLLIITTFSCIASACVALYIGLILEKDVPAFFTCSLSNAFGYTYTTFNYFFTSFGHLLGFLFNFIAFQIIQKFKTNTNNRIFSKEFDQIRLMHFISICSLIMVVGPNIFLYLARFFSVNYLILGWINCLFVFRSAFSLHLLGFRSPKFRERIAELSGCCFTLPKRFQSDAIKSISIPAAQQYTRRHTDIPITLLS